jgi:hypothetical protein
MSDDLTPEDRHDSRMPQDSLPIAESVGPAHEPEPVLQGEQRPVDPESAEDVSSRQVPGAPSDADVLADSRRHTRRAFLVAGAAVAAGYGFYDWLGEGPSDEDADNFLRKTLRFNADVARDTFHDHALAPTYPVSRAENLRVNGVYGLKKELTTERWRLQLVGMEDAERDPRYVKDVTAWEYHYSGASEGDRGHDTKVDPTKEAQGSKQDGTSTQPTAMKMSPAPLQAEAQAASLAAMKRLAKATAP